MLEFLNRQWFKAGLAADKITLVFIAVGMLLAMFSLFLNLHSVIWDGVVAGQRIGGVPEGFSKQVGFLLAPNWGLAGLILLPLAINNLLNARACVEPLIANLVETGMLINKAGESLTFDQVMVDWRRDAKQFTAGAFMFFLVVLFYVMFDDFYQVVFKWLIYDKSSVVSIITDPSKPVMLNHSNYEFDWSVAALFSGSETSAYANAAFSFFAYLAIPVIGAGTILCGFLWFISVSFFFAGGRLARSGRAIVPNIDSSDPRLGFELFEPMFDYLLKAGVATAVLALCMHLQNVFLRAPDAENIFVLVFGNTIDALPHVLEGNFKPLWNSVTSIGEALNLETKSISKQTYISAFALLLIVLIVYSILWLWLRKTALEGRDYLETVSEPTPDEQEKLDEMDVWPVGWVSLNVLLIVSLLIFMSMFFVNLISYLILLFLAWGIQRLAGSVLAGSTASKKRRRRRGPRK